jgi:hypothetical protein
MLHNSLTQYIGDATLRNLRSKKQGNTLTTLSSIAQEPVSAHFAHNPR